MNGATATTIYDKLISLDQEIQRLKLDAYFNLPKKSRPKFDYAESSIIDAVRQTRDDIWQKRYAKQTKNIS